MVISHFFLFKQRELKQNNTCLSNITVLFNDFFVDGIEMPDLRAKEYMHVSYTVMLADVLCSLCDSVQNKRQRRRCKRWNCIFTRDAW